ncbi:Tigger transposable element-derived protein 1-like 115, partial [Homarus americanus]
MHAAFAEPAVSKTITLPRNGRRTQDLDLKHAMPHVCFSEESQQVNVNSQLARAGFTASSRELNYAECLCQGKLHLPTQLQQKKLRWIGKKWLMKTTMTQIADAMSFDQERTVRQFWKNLTINDAVTNIALSWKSLSEQALNGVWLPLWPDVVQTFKGFTKDEELREIVLLSKKIREDPGFKEVAEEDVDELLQNMDDPLTTEEALELAEMTKTHEEEEEAEDEPHRDNDPDVERATEHIDSLYRLSSTYSHLLDRKIANQKQKSIISYSQPHSHSL